MITRLRRAILQVQNARRKLLWILLSFASALDTFKRAQFPKQLLWMAEWR
jgi:hypothetical protein